MRTKRIALLLLALPLLNGAFAADYYSLQDGVIVRTAQGKVRLKVINDKIIRVSTTPSTDFPKDTSLVVLPTKTIPKFTLTEDNGNVCIATSEIKAIVTDHTGEVTFFDKSGKKLLQENQNGRTFTPITVEGVDGYSVQQTFKSLYDDEGIYGLGQHQANEFNYEGKNEELFQYNTKVSVPFVVSTHNYGLLWDSYSLCRWGHPDDYKQLGDVFKLYDKNGKTGVLTGTYCAADGTTLVRDESVLYFEHLIRGDLNHVINLPQNFNFMNSYITFEGEIEANESGEFEFILYYSGYQTIYIGGKKVVDTRWRTAWNPNSYKFSVNFKKGEKVPVKIEWKPNGEIGRAHV